MILVYHLAGEPVRGPFMAAAIETLSRRDVQTLYLEHHGWLRQVLCRRLGSTADAADLAHDAFLRILVRPVGLHPDDRPQVRAYLKKMAQGLCIDLWRRREIERAWLESVALEPESTAPSAEHQAMIAEALYNIDAMLRSLPVKAARAFILRVGCEMTEQEVADELGVSTRMIRKYLAKAMLHCMQVEMGEAATPPAGEPL
jgi:RNA polymerase sigma factor (sigma-70 family)